jgi:hypothetical protein
MNIKAKKAEIRSVTKTIPVIEIDGVEIECPDDFEDLISALIDHGPGAFFYPVVINDDDLRESLEKAGLIQTNARGGSGATEKLCEDAEVLANIWVAIKESKEMLSEEKD